jgi:hypothetical protein
MITDSHWLWLGLVVLLAYSTWTWWCQLSRWRTAALTTTVRRLRPEGTRPRTPDDCPACRRQRTALTETAAPRTLVRPWRALKSRRGAPKPIDTQGLACPNRTCAYYAIIDAQIHAVVGDGTYGKCDCIQTFGCQACQTTFSARRATPL